MESKIEGCQAVSIDRALPTIQEEEGSAVSPLRECRQLIQALVEQQLAQQNTPKREPKQDLKPRQDSEQDIENLESDHPAEVGQGDLGCPLEKLDVPLPEFSSVAAKDVRDDKAKPLKRTRKMRAAFKRAKDNIRNLFSRGRSYSTR